MGNVQVSTREMVGLIHTGVVVETSVLANATYLLTDDTQNEIFNVYGRVQINQLFCEAITEFGAQATVMYYNFTSTTPAVAVQPMSAVSASMSGLAQGLRHVSVGGAVASACVVTATAGISDVISVAPQIIGTKSGVGSIGILTATASQLSGTCQFVVSYVPFSDGAYITAAL